MLRGRSQPQEAFLLAVNPAASAARELRLIRLESSVGSDESNDLIIRDDSVSRHHALVRRRGSKWQVIDRESTNGTYVGERKAVD
jgi:pSer/pThr/pTyr-binding forkhead associated (FHA) protein